ncbi:MAG: hypothetical protein J6K28_02485 [Alistipes sp.]|nr:hypothetical protein [Alistipes sp.]
MRKYLLLGILSAAMAVGCTKDDTTDQNGNIVEKTMMEVTASLEYGDDAQKDDTRTTLTDNGEGGKIAWSDSDVIGAVSEDGTITECPITGIAENGTAVFSVPTDTKYAFYPYATGASSDENGLSISLPQSTALDGSERIFGDGQNHMAAHLSGTRLDFKNLCGYIEVKLKGTQKVTAIALRDNVIDWAALSGATTVDLSDADNPALTMGTYHGTTFNWIYGTCDEPIQLTGDTAKSFYFIVPPATYNSLNLCIRTTDGSYSVTTKEPVTVNRSKIKPFAAIDLAAIAPRTVAALDAAGVANCYVVPQGDDVAAYSFAAKKINATKGIENIAYAQLVWSSDKDLINKVCYDAASERVSFEYAGGGAEGNALIAVVNAENHILWTWHIWCTDKPKTIRVKGGDNTTMYAILDRNIGATYAPKSVADVTGITDEDATAAVGLYYQYGRPQPFPGPKSIKTLTETPFKENSRVAVQYGFRAFGQDFKMANNANDFDTALQYPNLFFTCYVNASGAIQSGASGAAGNRWQKELINPYTGMERAWFSQNKDEITYKSDYDPCPYGYVVDDSSSGYHYLQKNILNRHGWGSAVNTIYGYYLYQESTGDMLYIPVCGYRDTTGKLTGVGQYLNMWFVPTSNQGDLKTYRFYSGNSTSTTVSVSSAAYANQSFGFNLRCRMMNRNGNVQIEDKPFAEGSGTETSPFIISTPEELIRLSDLCNGIITFDDDTDFTSAYYALGTDIDMKGKAFSAITPFKGHFYGKGHKIANLTVTPRGTAPTAMFGEVTDAEITDLRLESYSVTVSAAAQIYTAGIAAYCENSRIAGCSLSGSIVSGAKAAFSAYNSCSVIGGIAAYAINCEISDCTVEGYISGANQFVGGITAVSDGGKISGCTVKHNAEITGLMNHVGGITSLLRANGEISGCTVEASVMCKYASNGGICGSIISGIIDKCVVSGNAEVQGHVNNTNVSYIGTGGIVGCVLPNADTDVLRISDCACYCPVTANLALGGIVGQIKTNVTRNGISIINCLYRGHLTAVSKNTYNYAIAGGIIGWCNDGEKEAVTIANCAGLVGGINFDRTAVAAGFGGLGGYIRANTTVTACYSNLNVTDIVSDEGNPINSYSNILQYGGLYGASYGTAKNVAYDNCYWSSTGKVGRNLESDPVMTNCSETDEQSMTNGTLLDKLNAAAAAYNASAGADVQACTWIAGTDGYPVPSSAPENTAPSVIVAKTKVSVIGDSISTFSGYIPAGYATFYPTGTVVSAIQTYWYKLIYNYMSNAKLDMNIAWSGTLVTRSTDTSCASEHWYGHDFVARFIDKGVGNPDVILIHGGTNDVSGRGSVSLYPNYAIAGETYPSDAEFAACFATADAAETREAIEALDDTCFVNAYIKLIRLIRQQYPNAKVVMLIGDYIPNGARQTIHKIAAHYGELYGYRCVDFQDIETYRGNTVITKATGCHPDEGGFEAMAKYIYQSVGSYID